MITLSAIVILHLCMQLFRTAYGIMSETSTEVLYFDRNHLPTGVSIDSVSSRSFLACASLCHPNDCKSLFYDESSHWCRINVGIVAFPAGTTFHSRTPDYIKFVEFQRHSMVFEVAEAETNNFMLTCFTDLNCQASFSVNSECVGGNCTCLPCYEYIDGLCTAATCSLYGSDFIEYTDHVLFMNSFVDWFGFTLQECRDACLDESAFICRSFDFHASDGYCQLTLDDRCTDPDNFRSGYPGWSHYQRNCVTFV